MQSYKTILDFKQILNYCSFDTVALFDVDNTLIVPMTDLGSDHWFAKVLGIVREKIPPEKYNDTKSILLKMFNHLQNKITIQPTQNEIQRIIKLLQDVGIPVIAVTSRGYDLNQTTLDQLEMHDIDFTRKSLLNIAAFSLHKGFKDQPITYSSGILYCSGNNKGFCTQLLLRALKIQPNTLLMVDDTKDNLIAVWEALSDKIKKYTALRYGKLDQRIQSINLNDTIDELMHVFTWSEVLTFSTLILDVLIKYKLDNKKTTSHSTIPFNCDSKENALSETEDLKPPRP